jgi:hypothetical protein
MAAHLEGVFPAGNTIAIFWCFRIHFFCTFPIPGFPGADKLPEHSQMSGQIIQNRTDEGPLQSWPVLVGTGDDLTSWEQPYWSCQGW